MRLPFFLVFAAMLLSTVAYLRPPEYDEAYSIFLTAGDPRPAWPAGVFRPVDVRAFYTGDAGFWRIAQGLRQGDVHPPLYFWCLEIWRHVFGPSWLAARLLSVVFSIAALATLGRLAALAEVPVLPALLLTLLSYGFAYTGIIARGFALAQCLNIIGVALAFANTRRAGGSRHSSGSDLTTALLAGIALGAAGFANYLASFIGLATLVWLLLRDWRAFIPAACGFAAFLPADAYFFLAQRGTRNGQFASFSWHHALALMAKDSGAAIFGGLPLYAGAAGPALTLALLGLFAWASVLAVRHRGPGSLLFTAAALAMPSGLLILGLVFNNTPIEIRYLAFSLPFMALLFARLPRAALLLFLGAESCAIAGLACAPATMQTQGIAAQIAANAATPGTLVIVPYGNDGVGIPGPFLAAAPDLMRVSLAQANAVPDLSAENRVILAAINGDDASRLTIRDLRAAFAQAQCWRQSAAGLVNIYERTCHAD